MRLVGFVMVLLVDVAVRSLPRYEWVAGAGRFLMKMKGMKGGEGLRNMGY